MGQTLNKKNIREELVKFYKKYYSANLMKLCIGHNQNLDDFKTLKYFRLMIV